MSRSIMLIQSNFPYTFSWFYLFLEEITELAYLIRCSFPVHSADVEFDL